MDDYIMKISIIIDSLSNFFYSIINLFIFSICLFYNLVTHNYFIFLFSIINLFFINIFIKSIFSMIYKLNNTNKKTILFINIKFLSIIIKI